MSSPHETTQSFASSTGTSHAAPAIRSALQSAAYRDDARYSDETRAMNAASQAAPGQAAAASHTAFSSGPSGYSTPAATFSAKAAGTASGDLTSRLKLSPISSDLPASARPAEVLKLAIEAFPQTDTWVIFYREILGVDGVVRKLFPTADDLREWEASNEFIEVHTMLTALRSHDNGKGDTAEPQRMITVRLPVSLHEALKLESEETSLSINKLCITKLLHKMDARFVPQEPGKRRGRKPGPQGKRDKKVADAAN